ncbi:MAG: S-methyl-5-thioribose-1-phosphate isomerase [Planctomycetes bacterium]|nr:S-methyl-5-thioribose-1-phosphate isomerase [Planctomycetota bacterium]
MTSRLSNLPTTLRWLGDRLGYLALLDQTLLPTECREIECRDLESVWRAIRELRVRGAPAIGIAAGYGLTLGLGRLDDESEFFTRLQQARDRLAACRPTAVNLHWALDRVVAVAQRLRGQASIPVIHQAIWDEARRIHEQDRAICRAIGVAGADLLEDGSTVLTHCNAGALATSEHGTALGVIYSAAASGKRIQVFVDETRPLLQGARLSAWELSRAGVPVTLICDSMAAQVMREKRVQAVIVGADRIAANGDTANKIGTYSVACLARMHAIPFYVAAPSSTFDLTLSQGDQIPIETRDGGEISEGFGRRTAPDGIGIYNPAFDVTPAELITALITEFGVIRPVNAGTIRATVGPKTH